MTINIQTFGGDAGTGETHGRGAGRDDLIFLLQTFLQVPDLSLQANHLLAQLDDLVVLGGDLLVHRAASLVTLGVT